MNNYRLNILVLILSVCALLAVSACDKTPQAGKNKNLKLGCLAYSEPMIQWIKQGLEPLGYKVEVVRVSLQQIQRHR